MTGRALRCPLTTRDEAEALRRIARWLSATFVMWAMTLPVGFAALYAWPDGVFTVAAFWFALVVIVGIKGRGPCPRCKQRFAVQERGMNPWEKGCVNYSI
jgi:hypothetical protein